MNPRRDDTNSFLYRYAPALIVGTFANIFSTFVTLPMQYVFKRRQANPELSYRNLVGFTLSSNGFKEVYNQSKTVIKMAPKQSLAYLGVSQASMEFFRDDEALLRGVKAGLLSATAESIATAKDLQRMTSGWNHAHLENIDKKIIFSRSLQATMVKNLYANPITLAFYAYTNDNLQKVTQSNSPFISGLAGMISALCASPLIAPMSTLETRVQNNPNLTFTQHLKKASLYSLTYYWKGEDTAKSLKEVAHDSVILLWKGGAARGVYKAVDGMIKFGLISAGMRMIQNNTNQTQNVQTCKKL